MTCENNLDFCLLLDFIMINLSFLSLLQFMIISMNKTTKLIDKKTMMRVVKLDIFSMVNCS